MAITINDLKTIKADLAKLRPAGLTPDIDRSLSLKESILKLAPVLCQMKRRGFTTAEVVEALKKHGLHIKGATLNRYLGEYQAGKSANTSCLSENRKAMERTDQGVTNNYTPENQEAVTTERPRNIAPQAGELPESLDDQPSPEELCDDEIIGA